MVPRQNFGCRYTHRHPLTPIPECVVWSPAMLWYGSINFQVHQFPIGLLSPQLHENSSYDSTFLGMQVYNTWACPCGTSTTARTTFDQIRQTAAPTIGIDRACFLRRMPQIHLRGCVPRLEGEINESECSLSFRQNYFCRFLSLLVFRSGFSLSQCRPPWL